MGFVAVVPARGGSQEVPRKNLIRFGGLSLVQRSVLAARKAGADRVLLTTDSEEIAADGAAVGAEVPGLRPPELATATSKTADAVSHVLNEARSTEDIVIVLQPTSPLRKAEDIAGAVRLLQDRPAAEGVASIAFAADAHPAKMRYMTGEWLRPLDASLATEVPRQTLEGVYRLNGAIFGVRRHALDRTGAVIPVETLGFLMPNERSINLDTKWDFVLLEALLERGMVILETYE